MDRKFAFFALSFAATLLLLQSITGILQSALIATLATAGLSVFLFLKRKKKQAIFLIFGTLIAISLFFIYPTIDKLPEFTDGDMNFDATVIKYSYDNSSKTGVVCDVEITALDNNELDNSFTAKMYFRDKTLSLTPNDKISGKASFQIPENDSDFNAFTYNKTRGIDTIAFCNEALTSNINEDISIRFIPQWIAHNINLKLTELLPERQAGFISAILLGDKTEFTPEDKNNFTSIGLAHVVAVSGMHLSFLAGFMFLLFGKRRTVYFVIPVLVMFTLIVGAPPSVVRALIMHVIMILAPVLRGEADSVNSLSIALVALLIFNPYSVMDVGLQLSFLATLGIILFGNKIHRHLSKPFKFENKHIQRVADFVLTTLSVSISAIIFTTPVIAWNFGTVSIIAPISNMLLIWIINGIFIASIFVVILAFVCMPVAKIIVVPFAFVAVLILECAVLLAEIPFATIYIDTVYEVIVLAYIYIVLFLFINDKQRSFLVPIISVALVIAATMLVSLIPQETEDYSGIRFSVLDVGQGSCMLADYNGTSVMVDCGGSRAKSAGDIALDYLRGIDENSIDALVITHFDSDHINGARRLMERGDVKEIYIPANALKNEHTGAILETARDCEVKINYIDKETKISKNGLDFTIYPTGWFSESNENGLVVIFEKSDFEFVVTGDLGRKSEDMLCKTYDLPDAEVYIAGHHGSNSSSSIELMNKILPEFAVISVGADNHYGHPNKEILSLFDDMGIDVARTDECGNIVFYSDELMKEAA